MNTLSGKSYGRSKGTQQTSFCTFLVKLHSSETHNLTIWDWLNIVLWDFCPWHLNSERHVYCCSFHSPLGVYRHSFQEPLNGLIQPVESSKVLPVWGYQVLCIPIHIVLGRNPEQMAFQFLSYSIDTWLSEETEQPLHVSRWLWLGIILLWTLYRMTRAAGFQLSRGNDWQRMEISWLLCSYVSGQHVYAKTAGPVSLPVLPCDTDLGFDARIFDMPIDLLLWFLWAQGLYCSV